MVLEGRLNNIFVLLRLYKFLKEFQKFNSHLDSAVYFFDFSILLLNSLLDHLPRRSTSPQENHELAQPYGYTRPDCEANLVRDRNAKLQCNLRFGNGLNLYEPGQRQSFRQNPGFASMAVLASSSSSSSSCNPEQPGPMFSLLIL